MSKCVTGAICVSEDRSVIAPESVHPPKASSTLLLMRKIFKMFAHSSRLSFRQISVCYPSCVSTCVTGGICVSEDMSVIAPESVYFPKRPAEQTCPNEKNIQNVCSFKSPELSTVFCLLSWLS